jgi:hypothetical protein
MFVGMRIVRGRENHAHPDKHRQPVFEKQNEFGHAG